MGLIRSSTASRPPRIADRAAKIVPPRSSCQDPLAKILQPTDPFIPVVRAPPRSVFTDAFPRGRFGQTRCLPAWPDCSRYCSKPGSRLDLGLKLTLQPKGPQPKPGPFLFWIAITGLNACV